MALPVNYSSGIAEHIAAGHFTIYPKPWMGGKRIWIWTKGAEIVGGAVATRKEAEDAAVAWYNEQTA